MKDLKRSVSVQVIDSDFALFLPNGIYEIKPMEPRSKLRSVIIMCIFLAVSGIIGFGYFCPDQVCALSTRETVLSYQSDGLGKPLPSGWVNAKAGLSYEEVVHDDFSFDIDSHDVMVFLHIQKTGGTSFGRHLVHDLDLKRPCTCQKRRKRCFCFRPHSDQNWLFSRYTTGWRCGLHADWTELTSCVDGVLDQLEGHESKRKYFYISLLREPVARYLSEYRHVQRGATWKGSRHMCKGRTPTNSELPPCYTDSSWYGVKLDDFADCTSNLAANRQTRMLADLELVGCYNRTYMPQTERDRVLLASAKRNLASMAYFGLTEFQKISQYIFEETFNLRFAIPFEQNNATVSSLTMSTLNTEQAAKISHLNSLDIELYSFAKKLLFQRFEKLRSRDSDFKARFQHLGELPTKPGVTGFDWDNLLEDTTPSSAL